MRGKVRRGLLRRGERRGRGEARRWAAMPCEEMLDPRFSAQAFVSCVLLFKMPNKNGPIKRPAVAVPLANVVHNCCMCGLPLPSQPLAGPSQPLAGETKTRYNIKGDKFVFHANCFNSREACLFRCEHLCWWSDDEHVKVNEQAKERARSKRKKR